MTPEQKQNIDRLWKMQEFTRKQVDEVAKAMGELARAAELGVVVPDKRWDELFNCWESANKNMQDVGAALQKAHGLDS